MGPPADAATVTATQKEQSPEDEEDAVPYLQLRTTCPLAVHIVTSSVNWFNGSRERAAALADILLPDRKGISLRLIDHLVVQYSRVHVVPVTTGAEGGIPVDLWHDYRRKLSCTGKRYFDVFKRKNSVTATLLGTEIVTTIGQIVFLAWYQMRGLPKYMAVHEKEVRKHMQQAERMAKAASRNCKANSIQKKARAPSRSDMVKPAPQQHTGAFVLTFA